MTFKFWAAAGTLAIMLSSGLGTGVAAPPRAILRSKGQI